MNLEFVVHLGKGRPWMTLRMFSCITQLETRSELITVIYIKLNCCKPRRLQV